MSDSERTMKRAGSVWRRCCALEEVTRELAEMELREMPATDLIAEGEAVGIRLTVAGDQLRIRGPRPTESLGRLLLQRKEEVLAVLGTSQRMGQTATCLDPRTASESSIASDTTGWDADRAAAIVAEVGRLIDNALLATSLADKPARRKVLAHERGIVHALAAGHDPLLWEWPRALHRLLERWSEWDGGQGK